MLRTNYGRAAALLLLLSFTARSEELSPTAINAAEQASVRIVEAMAADAAVGTVQGVDAIRALAKDARFADLLIRVLLLPDRKGDSSNQADFFRSEAAQALGAIVDKRAVDPLISALSAKRFDGVEWTRGSLTAEAAAEALGEIGDRRAVEPLVSVLKSADGELYRTRHMAAEALGKLDDGRAVEPLLAALRRDQWSLRGGVPEAAAALGKISDPRAREALRTALKDEQSGVRSAAAKVFGELRDRSAVDSLVAALQDEAAGVRGDAAEALGKIGDERAAAPLIAALTNNTDQRVLEKSAEALARIGEPAIEVLVAMLLRNKDREALKNAVRALAGMGVPAEEPLARVLKNSDAGIRYRTAEALEALIRETAEGRGRAFYLKYKADAARILSERTPVCFGLFDITFEDDIFGLRDTKTLSNVREGPVLDGLKKMLVLEGYDLVESEDHAGAMIISGTIAIQTRYVSALSSRIKNRLGFGKLNPANDGQIDVRAVFSVSTGSQSVQKSYSQTETGSFDEKTVGWGDGIRSSLIPLASEKIAYRLIDDLRRPKQK